MKIPAHRTGPVLIAVLMIGLGTRWISSPALVGLASLTVILAGLREGLALRNRARARKEARSAAQTGTEADDPQMPDTPSDVHASLLALCERALDARLPYDEIISARIEPRWYGPFYEDVFDDLCFAVEHVPAKGFSRRINFEEWYASDMYDNLWLDVRLMRSGLSPAQMSSIRDSLVERERFTHAAVDARIARARLEHS